jgi:hypothetical protein
LSAIEILRSPVDCVSPDEARHLTWFVSWHKANQTAFVRHLDELALQRALDNLEKVFSKLCAGDLHDPSVP